MNIAVIFAGGSGVRMGAGVPKQFLEINGKPIIIHTLDIFENNELIDKIYISCKKEYISNLTKSIHKFGISKLAKIVEGGETGLDSIYNGLKIAYEENDKDDIVLIHDGVRPYLSEEVIANNIESVKKYGSAITCTPFIETPIISENGIIINEIPDKAHSFTAQAPQSFYLGEIFDIHNEVRKNNPKYTGIVDSCTLCKSINKETYIVIGNRGNIKVTTPEDYYILRALLQYKENEQILGLR